MEISMVGFIACLMATFSWGGVIGLFIGRIINNVLIGHIAKIELEINRTIEKTRRLQRAIETTSAEKIKK